MFALSLAKQILVYEACGGRIAAGAWRGFGFNCRYTGAVQEEIDENWHDVGF